MVGLAGSANRSRDQSVSMRPKVIAEPIYLTTLLGSAWLAFLTTLACLALALPLGYFIARVDLAFVEWKIALEYESIEWHTGKTALLRDNPRRRRMMGVGWKPLGVTVDDLRDGGLKLGAEIWAHARRAS